MAKYNIRQLTHRDIEGKPTQDMAMRDDFPGFWEWNSEQRILELNSNKKNAPYVKIYNGQSIIKFGYVCEMKGIDYPIYIKNKTDSNLRKIELNKTCIFEYQTEEYTRFDATTNKQDTYTAKAAITEMWVPANIKFTLDYVTNT